MKRKKNYWQDLLNHGNTQNLIKKEFYERIYEPIEIFFHICSFFYCLFLCYNRIALKMDMYRYLNLQWTKKNVSKYPWKWTQVRFKNCCLLFFWIHSDNFIKFHEKCTIFIIYMIDVADIPGNNFPVVSNSYIWHDVYENGKKS